MTSSLFPQVADTAIADTSTDPLSQCTNKVIDVRFMYNLLCQLVHLPLDRRLDTVVAYSGRKQNPLRTPSNMVAIVCHQIFMNGKNWKLPRALFSLEACELDRQVGLISLTAFPNTCVPYLAAKCPRGLYPH